MGLLGMITVLAIQRFVYKLIISLALTREFKADSANIAWWTGKWYSLGWHTLSQPGREFLCKITELGYFAGDFVLGHIILFMMLPVLLVPMVDKVHSVMLFWLRPSRQIRPPIYSLKQSCLRKRRVIRYAILYFILLVLFLVLVIAPTVVRQLGITPELDIMQLQQPNDWKNNDTLGSSQTGTALGTAAATGASASASGSAERMRRAYFYYES